MKNFKNILCVVTNNVALEHIVTMVENNQACLTVVNFGASITSSDLQAEISNTHEQEIESLVDPYRKRIPIRTKVLKGMPVNEIIREVMRNGHDLVIKTPECPVLLDSLFCSADMHLLRKCPCPVLLIKSTPPKPCRLILAAVDVDDTHPPAELKSRHALNQRIFETASSLALSGFTALHIVHAWHAVGESAMRGGFIGTQEEKVINYVEQLRRQCAANLDEFVSKMIINLEQDSFNYLQPKTHLVKGCAHKAIPALAKTDRGRSCCHGNCSPYWSFWFYNGQYCRDDFESN